MIKANKSKPKMRFQTVNLTKRRVRVTRLKKNVVNLPPKKHERWQTRSRIGHEAQIS